jgi:hypothetical protein
MRDGKPYGVQVRRAAEKLARRTTSQRMSFGCSAVEVVLASISQCSRRRRRGIPPSSRIEDAEEGDARENAGFQRQ